MKELEDSPHFPAWLRNFQTEFIGFAAARFHVYRKFVDYLRSLDLPLVPMSDQCSGNGDPARYVFRKSGCFSRLTLNDRFPNLRAAGAGHRSYTPYSVDIRKLTFQQGTCYTMFNAFHHFSEREQREILRRMQAAGSHGFFVELLEPTLPCLLKILLATTAGTLLLTPFVRPFSPGRIFFTYIIPLNVLTIAYDGIVSVFRSATAEKYRELYGNTGDPVQVLRLGKGFSPLIVLHIRPQ